MSTLVFDIETIGDNFDEYDSLTQSVLTKAIEKEGLSEEEYEAKLEEVKDKLGLSALTGQIVAISVLHVESNKGAVYFQAPGEVIDEIDENGIKYKSMSEKEILEQFWLCAKSCREFVTFNGRCFDVPFMMIRSAAQRIRPSVNLLSYRYLTQQANGAKHIDLMDQLTFYGAMGRGCKLHMCCQAFGIKSPKTEEVDGGQVGKMFKEKRYLDIAKYNMVDVYATAELFKLWNEFLRF